MVSFFYFLETVMVGFFIFLVVVTSWVLLLWGVVKTTSAGKAEHVKNRAYMVKTSYVLFFGSIFWFLSGSIRILLGFSSWGYFIFAVVLGWECYVFHKKAKALPRE